MSPKYFVIGFFGLGIAVVVSKAFMPSPQDMHSVQATSGVQGAPLTVVKVPKLSSAAEVGKSVFEANCSACHGENAAGQEGVAPPLVHIIYEPNHHADIAFFRAIKNGVRSHHWRFGNMPQVKGVDDEEAAKIVTYVRELQRANGIQ